MESKCAAMKTYPVQGVCSRAVSFRLADGVIQEVRFEGGCSGNTQGVARLIAGKEVREAIRRLKGIRCGQKASSCPDQLARALEKALSDT